MPVNFISKAKGSAKRVEAQFSGIAYAPHSHDSYTLALTTKGVQSFNYRGSLHHSLPGEVVILHPDEKHDGLAGNDDPFRYRAINIIPSDIQDILEGASLPFLAECVTSRANFVSIAKKLLGNFNRSLEPLEYEELVFEFANTMQIACSNCIKHTTANYHAITVAKEYIDDTLDEEITLEKLSLITNYSKWQITRDFRALYGTSPYRYLILRRLEKAKKMIEEKQSLADTALICNFSDQSHFSRQFKRCFGVTPKAWQKLLS